MHQTFFIKQVLLIFVANMFFLLMCLLDYFNIPIIISLSVLVLGSMAYSVVFCFFFKINTTNNVIMIQITNIFYWHIYIINQKQKLGTQKENIDRYRDIYIYVRVIKIIIIIQKTWLIIKYDHPSMKNSQQVQ